MHLAQVHNSTSAFVTRFLCCFILCVPLEPFVFAYFACSRKECSPSRDRLDDHLSDTVTAQSLASNKVLAFDASQCIEHGREEQDNRSDDKTGRLDGKRDPLNDTHREVNCGAHVIGLESANECVERGRRRADAQQERDFDKQNDERADTGREVSATYR